MLHVVLVEPQVAPNTGNIIRLCANTGAVLHLVEPLGFALDDRALRRAGLDYHDLACVQVHASWNVCRTALHAVGCEHIWAVTAEGSSPYDEAGVEWDRGDAILFGTERTGLIAAVRNDPEVRGVRIPMRPGNRSLNLANAVAVVVYEAWRRTGFEGAAGSGGTIQESIKNEP